MRLARPSGSPLVIELVGLPGAGKTSLVNAISVPHAGRRTISVWQGKYGKHSPAVFCAAIRLALSIRPFRISYVVRALKLAFALRCYGPLSQNVVVLDQGVVQKIWSMIIETRSYSNDRLEELIVALSPYAADQIVWLSVPARLAAERINARKSGNSRFDGLEMAEVEKRLRELEATYQEVLDLFVKHSDAPVLSLQGDGSLEHNAKIVGELISQRSTDSK